LDASISLIRKRRETNEQGPDTSLKSLKKKAAKRMKVDDANVRIVHVREGGREQDVLDGECLQLDA
jgi:hypothetical protein